MIQSLNDKQVNTILKGFADEMVDFNNNKPQWRLNGSLEPLMDKDRPRVAIVGTRDLKVEQWPVIAQLVADLAANPAKPVIISGLAYGTDTEAHKAAITYGLPTYAIMPCGLDMIYPSSNKDLAQKMVDNGGGLLSYFPDGTCPEPLNFLHRNKAIALMADYMIVPFSKDKGGAIVTAKLAQSYGNAMVYAFPGDLWTVNCRGCNKLIQQGIAEIVCEPHLFRDMELKACPRF